MMKVRRNLLKLLTVCAFAAMTSTGFAADSSVGCGLGNMVFQKNSIISAISRATTNQTFSSQLFGITSGTSGCASHSLVNTNMAPVYYAEANLEGLKLEMVKGQGEYLSAFATTLGCTPEAGALLGDTAQKEYARIFPSESTTAHEMLKNVKGIIQSNSALQTQCTNALI